jgi:uncharacterized delta-60 repeat protein
VERTMVIKNTKKIGFSLFFLISLLTISFEAHAYSVELDTSFNETGSILFNYGEDPYFTEMKFTSDGKQLLAGTNSNGSDNDVVLLQLNSDGSVDTSFGDEGYATLDFGYSESLKSIAIDSLGRIIISLFYYADQAYSVVARLKSDGSLDTSFGVLGSVILEVEEASFKEAVVDSQDRIVVVGHHWNEAYVVRLTSSGGYDNTFGVSGYVTYEVGDWYCYAYNVLIDSQERIVFMATQSLNEIKSIFIGRLLDNGALDTSFSGDGKATFTNLAAENGMSASDIAINQADEIFAIGSAAIEINDEVVGYRSMLVKIDENGSVDETFGNSGYVNTISADFNEAMLNYGHIQIDSFDNLFIYVSVYESFTENGSVVEFYVFMFDSNGSLNTAFNDVGYISSVGGMMSSSSSHIFVQSDEKISLLGIHNIKQIIYDATIVTPIDDDDGDDDDGDDDDGDDDDGDDDPDPSLGNNSSGCQLSLEAANTATLNLSLFIFLIMSVLFITRQFSKR